MWYLNAMKFSAFSEIKVQFYKFWFRFRWVRQSWWSSLSIENFYFLHCNEILFFKTFSWRVIKKFMRKGEKSCQLTLCSNSVPRARRQRIHAHFLTSEFLYIWIMNSEGNPHFLCYLYFVSKGKIKRNRKHCFLGIFLKFGSTDRSICFLTKTDTYNLRYSVFWNNNWK